MHKRACFNKNIVILSTKKGIDKGGGMYYNSYVNKSCDGESSLSRDAKRVGYGVSRRKELSMKITPELPPEIFSRVCRLPHVTRAHIGGYVD